MDGPSSPGTSKRRLLTRQPNQQNEWACSLKLLVAYRCANARTSLSRGTRDKEDAEPSVLMACARIGDASNCTAGPLLGNIFFFSLPCGDRGGDRGGDLGDLGDRGARFLDVFCSTGDCDGEPSADRGEVAVSRWCCC